MRMTSILLEKPHKINKQTKEAKDEIQLKSTILLSHHVYD